jgi:hypothetical protein
MTGLQCTSSTDYRLHIATQTRSNVSTVKQLARVSIRNRGYASVGIIFYKKFQADAYQTRLAMPQQAVGSSTTETLVLASWYHKRNHIPSE